MSTFAHTLRRVIRRRDGSIETAPEPGLAVPDEPRRSSRPRPAVDIAPNDPLIAYLQTAGGAVELDRLELDSPAVDALRAAGRRARRAARLGRRADRDAQPRAAALRPAVLERRQAAARLARGTGGAGAAGRRARPPAGERGRLARADRAGAPRGAADPAELPPARAPGDRGLAGSTRTTSRPARSAATSTTSSSSPDGQLGVVVGDVTDKGVPAAMVMAAARSVLRATAGASSSRARCSSASTTCSAPTSPRRCSSPASTASSTPRRARFRFANAGHNLPFARTPDGAVELRATGMPLGLMPGMSYEEKEAWIAPGRVAAPLLGRRHRGALGRARDVRHATAGGLRRGGDELIDGLLDEPRRLHGRGLGAGGRHHARTIRRTAARPTTPTSGRPSASRAGPGTTARRWSASPPRSRPRARATPARAAEDGRRRGGDERDRARQPEPRGTAGRHRGRRSRRRARRPHLGRGPRRARPAKPRRPISRPSSRACRSRAAGASS